MIELVTTNVWPSAPLVRMIYLLSPYRNLNFKIVPFFPLDNRANAKRPTQAGESEHCATVSTGGTGRGTKERAKEATVASHWAES